MRHRLVLKNNKTRSVVRRHPWVYSGAAAYSETDTPGEIVAVVDEAGTCYGLGHLSPESALACRIFYWTNDPEAVVDEAFWAHKLKAAMARRKLVIQEPDTTGFRLVNAEGDGLPGIIIDRYGPAAVMQLRTEGAAALAPTLAKLLQQQGVQHLYLQAEEGPGTWLAGEPLPEIAFMEHGHTFYAAPEHGQKTGFFLDQRANRALVGSYAKGRNVLNAFSYTGGFSVYALAGGAQQVLSVDSSGPALEAASSHVAINNGPQAPHATEQADCFRYLRTIEPGAWDLIILDPPALTKHPKTVTKATRGYKDINLSAFRHVAEGGLVATFSCSQHISTDLFRKVVFGAAADAGRPVQVLHELSHGPDHPVDIYHPEGQYLKGLLMQVGGAPIARPNQQKS